ncbi:MAG: hypothetical protein COV73_02350 [Candidatus Omnitrophica bacterium CG11_big_fil_rev_8_21_14_0_20_43_6]|nr:MAG: hypothetical protein COV73_02350 [Candidatus Omnitrophica bacterium CG11_big_fil_rev_8_21_14_0_20_43_6]
MRSLDYYNVKIERLKNSNRVFLKGEITNNTGKSYNTVAVRVILFVRNVVTINEVFLINDLPAGATKAFDRHLYDLEPGQSFDDITRHELFTENCY